MTQYGLGARGIDYMRNPAGTGGWTAFPVYDSHGNMVATLSRNGLGWALGNQRSFDCWGNVRLGAPTGDPAGRYCGNLGHKQDDESGLIYMRARYYEPSTGRFISEDPSRNGGDWYAYAGCRPTAAADYNGRSGDEIVNIVREMLNRGFINSDFFDAFMDKSTGIRQIIQRLVEDAKLPGMRQLPMEDVMDIVQYENLKYTTSVSMETDAELAGDVAAGDTWDEILLEEEATNAEVAEGGLEG